VRVQRTFAFIDLSGFTALTAAHGDEHAVEVLEHFRSRVRKICSRRGVRIAKWLGDGAMLVGVESTPLLSAVLEMQAAPGRAFTPVALRCGASIGSVILLEGDDYIGHAVNVAARLCDLAGPGTVLATPEVSDHLPPWAAARERDGVVVKGLDHPLPLVELELRRSPAGDRPDPVCGIPLWAEVAAARRTVEPGEEVLFCSDSCLETWDGRAARAAAAG
jgi:class 3 adenylate cyclase